MWEIFEGGAVREMEACWPSGVGLSGAGVKPPCAALAEDRRGERQGEGAALIASGGDREDVPESSGRAVGVSGVAVEASKGLVDIETGGPWIAFGMSLAGARFLARWCPA